jgi:hypothetical protein
MMRFSDESLRVIAGTDDGELTAEAQLKCVGSIGLANDARRLAEFDRSATLEKRRLDWREATMRLELRLVWRVSGPES